jgi:UDP-N-acetylmuramoyl-tripeptide--D-alanyl-D-alanine ligase
MEVMDKIKLTIEDIFNIPGAEIFNPDSFKSVNYISVDSRNLKKNSLFVALKGKRLDAHDFVKDAVKNGAAAVVINRNRINSFDTLNVPVITVKNTTLALGDLARIWREKLKTKVIGITGSTGKTSTKEMLSAILSERFKVNKTLANNNNHIGVPLTLLSTNNSHEVLVAELGTNHFGEIAYTAAITQPDYALITNIGDSHLQYLVNRKGVLKEKLALFEAAALKNGTLFINDDDKYLKKVLKSYPAKVTYSLLNKDASKSSADVTGKITGYTEDGKAKVELRFRNKVIKEVLPVYGEQSVKNLLACTAVAFKLGLTKEEISRGIKKLTAADKRLNVKNKKNYLIIDDTYNANPESMKAAFDLLGNIKKFSRKIAIVGDMLELGEESIVKHKELAATVKSNRINEVYTIGKYSKNLSDSLKNSKTKVQHFSSRKSLVKFLNVLDFNSTAVLVKGSRGMKMEEFVQIISNR